MNDFENNTNSEIIDYTPIEHSSAQGQGGKIRIILGFLITWGILGYGFYEINNVNQQLANKEANNINPTEIHAQISNLDKKNQNITKQITLNTQSIDILSNSLSSVEKTQTQRKQLPIEPTIIKTITVTNDNEFNQLQQDLLATIKIVQTNLENSIKNKISTVENNAAKQIIKNNKKILVNNKQLVELTQNLQKLIDKNSENHLFNSTTYTLLKLRNSIRNAQDYAIELDILDRLTKPNPNLNKYVMELKAIISDKADNTNNLGKEFISIINNIKISISTKAIKLDDDETFWGSVKASISTKVSVEKIAQNTEDNNRIDNIAKKTIAALKAGDLNSAIKDSGGFNSSEAKILANWRIKLKNLYRTEQLFNLIYNASITKHNQNDTNPLPM